MPKSIDGARSALVRASTAARSATGFDGDALATEFMQIAATLGRPPLIAVVGAFDAGKSTLINRLLGVEVLPTDILPTTARPARIQHGDRPGLVLNRIGGFRELRGLEDLDRYANKSGEMADHLGLVDVATLEVFLPNEVLARFQLLDTPGISDPNQDVSDTLASIAEADAVVWCTMATAAWKQSEAEFWSKMDEDVRRTAILVVTHCDVLNDEAERDRVRRRLDAETNGAFGRVIMADLRLHRDDQEHPSVVTIRSALDELVHARAQELRVCWAGRAAREQVGRIRTDAAARAAADQEDLGALESACDEAAKLWVSVHKQVAARVQQAASQYEELLEEAASLASDLVVRVDFQEPEEVCEEGIFVDDYKVKWRNRWMETLDWDGIEKAHERLWKQCNRLTSTTQEALSKVVDGFSGYLMESVGPLLERRGLYTHVAVSQLQLHQAALESHVLTAEQRSLGSIESGGLYFAWALQSRSREHRKSFPRGSELGELMKLCFSFEQSANVCRGLGEAELDAMNQYVEATVEDWRAERERSADRFASVNRQLEAIEGLLP